MWQPCERKDISLVGKEIKSEGPVGGKRPTEGGGGSFDVKFTRIKEIRISYQQDSINSMKFEYENNDESAWSNELGASYTGSKTAVISFTTRDEYLISVSGYYGNWKGYTIITSITFESNKRTFGPFGASSGTKFSFAPSKSIIVGFHGIYGGNLDSIGVHWISVAHQPEIASYDWNDGVHKSVRKIQIHYCCIINSIRFEYEDTEGSSLFTEHRGEPKGSRFTIELAYPKEYIVRVYGFMADGGSAKGIQSLIFESNWRKYERIGGGETGNTFVLPQTEGKITGFFGKAGTHLESLGATSIPSRIYEPVGPFGGLGANKWDDKGHYGGIRHVKVVVKDFIISCIQIQYATKTGQFVWSDEHGSSQDGEKFEFSLDYPRESLVSVLGCYDPTKPVTHINSLTFKSNKKDYGPYGFQNGLYFIIGATKTKIVGFHGTNDIYLASLGAHIVESSDTYPTDPVIPNPNPTDAVKPSPNPSDLVKPSPNLSDLVNSSHNPTDHVHPNPNPTDHVHPNPNPTDHVHPNPNPTDHVHPNPNPTDPVKPNSNPTDPLNPNPNPTDPLHPNPNPTDPVNPNPNPVNPNLNPTDPVTLNPVNPNPNPTNPVNPNPNPVNPNLNPTDPVNLNPVNPNPNPTNPVNPNTNPSDPVNPEPEPNPKPMAKLVGPFGGKGGNAWDDGIYETIKKINITYDNEDDGGIETLKFEYFKTGYTRKSKERGTVHYGITDEIKIDGTNEFLVSVEGYYDKIVGSCTPIVQSLAFTTNKKTYGPYGPRKGTKFLLGNGNTKIVGFNGRADQYIDSLGVYVIEN